MVHVLLTLWYTASGFVASTDTGYFVGCEALIFVGAGAGVVGASLVWQRSGLTNDSMDHWESLAHMYFGIKSTSEEWLHPTGKREFVSRLFSRFSGHAANEATCRMCVRRQNMGLPLFA